MDNETMTSLIFCMIFGIVGLTFICIDCMIAFDCIVSFVKLNSMHRRLGLIVLCASLGFLWTSVHDALTSALLLVGAQVIAPPIRLIVLRIQLAKRFDDISTKEIAYIYFLALASVPALLCLTSVVLSWLLRGWD